MKASHGVLSPPQEESLQDEAIGREGKVSWNGQGMEDERALLPATIHSENRETNTDMDVLDVSNQTPGNPQPPNPDLEGMEYRYGFKPLNAEDRARRRSSRSRGRNTQVGSPQLSVEEVPPRTSSKQRANTDVSIGYPSIQRPQSRERLAASPPRVPRSPERRSERRSKRPSILDLHDSHYATSPSPTNLQQNDAEHPRLHSRETRQSHSIQQSFPSARNALQSALNLTRSERASSHLEELAKEWDRFSAKVGRENSPSPKTRHGDRVQDRTLSTTSSRRTQTEQPQQHAFYLSPNGDIEPYVTTQVPDPIPRGSIDTTPQHFYAPMRVPPNLTNNSITPRPEALKASRDATKTPSGSFRNSVVGGLRRQGTDEEIRTGSRMWAVNTLSSERLQKFQTSSHDKSPCDLGTHLAPKFPTVAAARQAMAKEKEKEKDQSSTRTTASDPEGSRPGVKAMAAFFEEPEPVELSSSRSKQGDRGLHHPQSPVNKAASLLTKSSPAPSPKIPLPQSSWSAKSQYTSTITTASKPTAVGTVKQKDRPATPRLRTSVSDSVALRAAALIEAERQHQGPSTERLPLGGLRQAFAANRKKPESDVPKDFQSQMKVGQSLGTMTPHQEQPPIAQHLNLARPPSAASSIANDHAPESPLTAHQTSSSTPLTRPSSTTSLHSQIRNLQRQLEARTEEAAQLRRQVEAQEDTDVGTLSEQLREAKREAQMWKERAEAAERRVKVFERFTAKLKGIREAAAAADQREEEEEEDLCDHEDCNEENSSDGSASPNQRVRFLEGRRTKDWVGSDDSGRTEDAGVVTARIRKCLHGSQQQQAARDQSQAPSVDGVMEHLHGQDYHSNNSNGGRGSRNIHLGADEIWMAAQELLDMDGMS